MVIHSTGFHNQNIQLQLATPQVAQQVARYPQRTQHIIQEMYQVLRNTFINYDNTKILCPGSEKGNCTSIHCQHTFHYLRCCSRIDAPHQFNHSYWYLSFQNVNNCLVSIIKLFACRFPIGRLFHSTAPL